MSNRFEVLTGTIPSAKCSTVLYDDGQLQVIGGPRDGEPVIRIAFASALLVRIADEGLRLRLLDELGQVRGVLLKCGDSELIKWVSDESVGIKGDGLHHFMVLLGEEIIDVISADRPTVEIINR